MTARTVLAGLALALLAIVATSPAASAHDWLSGSDPASGAGVSSLTAVTLTFSADPLDEGEGNAIQVKGPDGRYHESGCPTLDGPEMTTEVAAGPPGTYEVLWRVVSSDGHPVTGSYTFEYTGEAATEAGADAPRCGGAPTAEAGSAEPPSPIWIGLGIGAAAVVAVALGAVVLVRRPAR